jgi:predicted NAD/FAD-binding protein
MYGYSIPFREVDNFPAEIAIPLLRHSGVGTKWTRIKGGVYTYFEKMLSQFDGKIHLNTKIKSIYRNANGVILTMTSGEKFTFDKVVFATTPDQVLKILADSNEMEIKRFSSWQSNCATTVIHTDVSFYKRYGVKFYSEFDVFQKDVNGDCGYNAYLNRICGFDNDSYPHFSLAYNLLNWIAKDRIIHEQPHTTPLYTVKAIRYRKEVIETNGENNTYHVGAYLGNGLHEGAINSAVAVSDLLGGTGFL